MLQFLIFHSDFTASKIASVGPMLAYLFFSGFPLAKLSARLAKLNKLARSDFKSSQLNLSLANLEIAFVYQGFQAVAFFSHALTINMFIKKSKRFLYFFFDKIIY